MRRSEAPMGVATKGRRKLEVNGRRFVWYVREDDDSRTTCCSCFQRTIASEFIITWRNHRCHGTSLSWEESFAEQPAPDRPTEDSYALGGNKRTGVLRPPS